MKRRDILNNTKYAGFTLIQAYKKMGHKKAVVKTHSTVSFGTVAMKSRYPYNTLSGLIFKDTCRNPDRIVSNTADNTVLSNYKAVFDNMLNLKA